MLHLRRTSKERVLLLLSAHCRRVVGTVCRSFDYFERGDKSGRRKQACWETADAHQRTDENVSRNATKVKNAEESK